MLNIHLLFDLVLLHFNPCLVLYPRGASSDLRTWRSITYLPTLPETKDPVEKPVNLLCRGKTLSTDCSVSDPSLVFGLGGAGARSLVFGLLGVPNRECVLPIPLGGEDPEAELGVWS